MNIAITNFVKFLTDTVRITREKTPNYENKMPPSSSPITYDTYHGMYSDKRKPRWRNDEENLSTASQLVSPEARTDRVKLTLADFSEHLGILFDYLKNNEVTFEEKTYLLINLDAYLKEMPATSYAKYTYTVTAYNENNDIDYESWPISHSIKCPIGSTGVNLELNTLKSLALEQILIFNSRQIKQQLPPPPPKLPFINEEIRAVMPMREENIPIVMQPTLFDFLTDHLLTASNEKLTYYNGLSRLKSDPSFGESLNNNTKKWIETFESPQRLRETIAYKIAATPREPSIFTFFGGTHTQNIFEQTIAIEIKKRKQAPVIRPTAPPQLEPVLAVATPVNDNQNYVKSNF